MIISHVIQEVIDMIDITAPEETLASVGSHEEMLASVGSHEETLASVGNHEKTMADEDLQWFDWVV